MNHRRTRPTLRVLREDLIDGWATPYPRRKLEEENHFALHPLSELPHPIVRKGLESVGADAGRDNVVGVIASSKAVRLLEIRASQWRGAVWEDDETGVHWLVAAGLAKGGHEDHDDFYKRIARADDRGTLSSLLPTDEDRRLLKQETAARRLTEWELAVQRSILVAIRRVADGGRVRTTVEHPVLTGRRFAEIDLQVVPVRETDYAADEIVVVVTIDPEFRSSKLVWPLQIRTLISLSPPEQGWDRTGDTFSNIGEVGAWSARTQELHELVERAELAESRPGDHAHYAHRMHIAGSTVTGVALRALCGVYFVARQDPHGLERCPQCDWEYNRLSSWTTATGADAWPEL